MKASLKSLSLLALVTGITALPTTLDVVGYWGVHGGNVGEKNLGYYCDTGAYTIINLAFIDTLTDPHNLTANIPSAASSNGDIVTDIQHCQASGVRIFISIGGYIANVPITDSATGEAYADGLWNSYFGGSDSAYHRPFGPNVVLDGLDLDLEQSSTSGYVALVNKLKKTYFASAGRSYWISAAPQCGIPDPNMDSLLKTVWFDYVNPQFYNNWCFFTGTNMNYANVSAQYGQSWVEYASNFVNPATKLLLGVPAPGGGNGGDADVLPTVKTVVPGLAKDHADVFGGVMFWDCFWAGPAWAKSIRSVVDQACGGQCKTVKPPGGRPSGSPTSVSAKSTASPTTSSVKSTAKPTSGSASSTGSPKPSTKASSSTISTTVTSTTVKASSSTSSSGSVPTSGPCSSSGQMACVSSNGSPAYAECVNGQWSVFNCGAGTVCQSTGGSVICSYKHRRIRRRPARLRE